MDLAYVDKLAEDNNGVNYLLACQDLFDETVDTEGMKTKDSKKNNSGIFDFIYKKESTQKNGDNKGKEVAVEFTKL